MSDFESMEHRSTADRTATPPVSTQKFQPGDILRVTKTFETTVRETGWYHGKGLVAQGKATVELIERADDPSKDPVGTVRQDASAPTFVAVKSGNYHDSDSKGRWMILDNGACQYSWRTDQEMIGWPVVGVTPFTPAAEKQSADELSREQGHEERKDWSAHRHQVGLDERPLWTGDGSEEPPAHVKQVRAQGGNPHYHRHPGGWSLYPIGDSRVAPWEWTRNERLNGPFTEVRD